MTPVNKIRLLMAIERDNPVRSAVDPDETLALGSRDIFAQHERVVEVWFSPTGFGPKDDARSVGFMRLPACLAYNERSNRHYKLSVLSTSITKQFHDDWNKVLPLPQATIEHQTAINAGLFFES